MSAFLIVHPKGEAPFIANCSAGMVIGRASDCGLVLPGANQTVSRHHVCLDEDAAGQWIFTDQGSRNGTYLNRERLDRGTLRDGDALRIGPHVLVFKSADPASLNPTSSLMTGTRSTTVVPLEQDGASALSHGSRDGPAGLDRQQLVLLQRVVRELSQRIRPQEVYDHAAELLASATSASAVMVLRVPSGEVSDRAQVLAISDGPGALPDVAMRGVPISRTLIEAVLRERVPVLAGAETPSPDALALSRADWSPGTQVVGAPAHDHGPAADVICFVFEEPGPSIDLDFLGTLAVQVGLAADSARHVALTHELVAAGAVQRRLILARPVAVADAVARVKYRPHEMVGGDYADAWPLEDQKLAFAIADVCGHGYAAALVMSNVAAAMRSVMDLTLDPARAVNAANRQLLDRTPDHVFVTLMAGILDARSDHLEMVLAGHPPPILLNGATGAQRLDDHEDAAGPPLGISDHEYISAAAELPKRHALLAVTDGMFEVQQADGGMWSLGEMEAWVAKQVQADQALVTQGLLLDRLFGHCEQLLAHTGSTDDQTAMLITRGTG